MSCAIAVMAKAPQPGRCKTRLLPRLSAQQAAALSAAFLRDVTGNLQAASQRASIAPFVAYAPAGAGPLFNGMLAPGTGLILADGSIDSPPGVRGFGTCLLHALRALFALGHQAACVLNADSPNLPTAYLRLAADALARPGERVVIGPAEDGGYYLLGATQAHAGLFTDIDWSTAQVFDQTMARANALGLEVVLLPAWYDVDEPAALDRLIEALEHGTEPDGYPAPATRLALQQMVFPTSIAAAD
jgi:rSAM/selenodomain-associated transferase 1